MNHNGRRKNQDLHSPGIMAHLLLAGVAKLKTANSI